MKIRLFYDDEYIEDKEDYSYMYLTVDSWEDFWNLWNDKSDFIRCDSDMLYGNIIYLRKDRVIQIMGEKKR